MERCKYHYYFRCHCPNPNSCKYLISPNICYQLLDFEKDKIADLENWVTELELEVGDRRLDTEGVKFYIREKAELEKRLKGAEAERDEQRGWAKTNLNISRVYKAECKDLEKRLSEPKPPHPDCFYHGGRGCNNLRMGVESTGERGLIEGEKPLDGLSVDGELTCKNCSLINDKDKQAEDGFCYMWKNWSWGWGTCSEFRRKKLSKPANLRKAECGEDDKKHDCPFCQHLAFCVCE